MFAQGELAEMRLPPQYMFHYKYVPSKRRFLGVYVITCKVFRHVYLHSKKRRNPRLLWNYYGGVQIVGH